MAQPRATPGPGPAVSLIGAACLAALLALFFAGPSLAAGLPAQIGGADSPFVLPPEIPGLFIVGLLLGFFGGTVAATSGACGGFLAVPALMGLGLRGIQAVGSELIALTVFGLLGGLDHFRAGKLHNKLALFLVLGALPGAAAGGLLAVDLYLKSPNQSDLVMALAQAVLLLALAGLALLDLIRYLRGDDVKKAPPKEEEEPRRRGRDAEDGESGTKVEVESSGPSGFLALLRDPQDPTLGAVSALIALGLGLCAGFFLAMAGATGGALTLPLLSGVFGLAAIPAAGADMLGTGLAAGVAAIFYSPAGLLTCTTAAGLLLGLLSGLRLSRPVLRFINPVNLKSFYLAVVTAVLLNRLLTLPSVLAQSGRLSLGASLNSILHSAAGFLVFMVPLSFALWVLIALFSNLGALRRGTGAKGFQRKPLLLSALCTFLALGVLWAMAFTPVMGEESLLETSDNLLLSRLKGQGLRYGDLSDRLKAMNSTSLRLALVLPTPRQANAVAAIITQYGYNVAPAGNRLDIPYLDTKAFARQALLDADAVYNRSGRALAIGAGLPERETLYLLWSLSGTLGSELGRTKHEDAAALFTRLQVEVLEPTYNLQTVRPQLGPIGWFWLAAMLASMLAMGLLWRAGGNLLLTGLGVAFLRDPAPVVPEAEAPPAEAPKKPAGQAPAPAAKPEKPAKAEKQAKPEAEAKSPAKPEAEAQKPTKPDAPAAEQAKKPTAKPAAKAPETPQAAPAAKAPEKQAQPAAAKPAQPAAAKPAQPAAAKPAQQQAKPAQAAAAKPAQAAAAKPQAQAQAKPQPKAPPKKPA